MALFTHALWALSLLLMWTNPCESRLVTIKMENFTRDMDIVHSRVSELSVEYKTLEGTCIIWAHERVQESPGLKPKSCVEVQEMQSESGVATIYPADNMPIQVYCDQDTDGGGWTVFQRRQDGSVDFYRNWIEYQNGFGDLDGEFWLGLDALHMLTSKQQYELRVDLMKWDNTTGYATYSNFSISDSSDNYRLTYGGFTGGNAGDSLSRQRGQQFSTKDRDHDAGSGNCAQDYHGAWWYQHCQNCNLNGEYKPNSTAPNYDGLRWAAFEYRYSMKFTEMKIRPI